MNNGVKKVRESINKRKKTRYSGVNKTSSQQILPTFPQEEEKHGYFPSFLDSTIESKYKKGKLLSGYMIKGIISMVLFFGVYVLFQSEGSFLDKPKHWTSHALTAEFPFARVSQWYQTTFGAPLTFSPQNEQIPSGDQALALPVNGNITESFQANGSGIKIALEESTHVSAMHEGVVIFAGNDRDTEKTIVIQHADDSKSTYGYLSSIDVHLYQLVQTNQRIGISKPTESNETLYFSIEKDNTFIDPVQVIKVDDLP